MHPEILRQAVAQRQRDVLGQVRQARAVRQLRNGARRQEHVADGVVIPAIPDYVDGTFLVAGDDVISEVPASRSAA